MHRTLSGGAPDCPVRQATEGKNCLPRLLSTAPSCLGAIDSRLEGGVNRAKLKFININTTTSRVSVRNINESAREGAKQIASK